MKSKRGLSEVVATMLTVLITIAAISFIASLVIPFVRNGLSSSTECFPAKDYFKFDDSQGYNCYDSAGRYALSVTGGNVGESAAKDQENRYHSADTNKNWNIDSNENNKFRTIIGAYHCDPTTVDGYASGAGDQTCSPHSADTNSDWNIDSNEVNTFNTLISNNGDYYLDSSTNKYVSGVITQAGSNVEVGNNITGFALVFGGSGDSTTIKVSSGDVSSSAVGGIRVIGSSGNINVSSPGETMTYVYNAGQNNKYSQVYIAAILRSGKICEKSDSVTFNPCTGVDLTL